MYSIKWKDVGSFSQKNPVFNAKGFDYQAFQHC